MGVVRLLGVVGIAAMPGIVPIPRPASLTSTGIVLLLVLLPHRKKRYRSPPFLDPRPFLQSNFPPGFPAKQLFLGIFEES